jgi:hypothetical protein
VRHRTGSKRRSARNGTITYHACRDGAPTLKDDELLPVTRFAGSWVFALASVEADVRCLPIDLRFSLR